MMLMNPDYLSSVDARFSKMFLCNLYGIWRLSKGGDFPDICLSELQKRNPTIWVFFMQGNSKQNRRIELDIYILGPAQAL